MSRFFALKTILFSCVALATVNVVTGAPPAGRLNERMRPGTTPPPPITAQSSVCCGLIAMPRTAVWPVAKSVADVSAAGDAPLSTKRMILLRVVSLTKTNEELGSTTRP